MPPPKLGKKYQPAGVGMTPSKTELGKFIRERRLELGLRQIPVAQVSGLSAGNNELSRLEIGTRKYLSSKKLEGLAKVLQVDPEELRKRMPEKYVLKPTTELSKLIRARREELSLSLEAFAEKLGLTYKQAKHLEVKKNPTLRNYKLARSLSSALELELSIFTRFVVSKSKKQVEGRLGSLIRARRQELGMTGRELAKKLDVSHQFINLIELGKIGLVKSDDVIEHLAGALELEADELKVLRPLLKEKSVRRVSERKTALGKFITEKRLELGLTQAQVAKSALTFPSTISSLERGMYRPGDVMLERISQALECEIPAEFLPATYKKAQTAEPRLWDDYHSDLEAVKLLTGIRAHTEVVRRAVKLSRLLLEKKRDGHTVEELDSLF